MPRLAANLSMMFGEHDFLDRFAAAARCGFKGVEFLFPYDWPAEEVKRRLDDAKLSLALFNLPPGDWAKGERGLAALPGREAEFAQALDKAIHYARVLGCPTLHVMAGILPADGDRADYEARYVGHLKKASAAFEKAGITGVVEPLNSRDVPGYLFATTTAGVALLDRAGAPNLALQFDLYHAQIMEGDLAIRFERLFDRVGHVQIAGNPARNEPDIGEVHYPFLFDLMDRLGYAGWVGCEYRPKGKTEAGLGWAAPYGIKAAG